ncbi:hypothetical protein ABZS83_05185 [Streptomyces sp. NPDC005426]|uniref:hypothetical protein n=1 Tax=Streptomyces sp. NPDC005426 TaxID=3155344 RepID=UPI0033BE7D52
MKYSLKPLIQPLGDGSVILYDRITDWVTSPKYQEVPAGEGPAKDGEKPKDGKAKTKSETPAEKAKGEESAEKTKKVLDKRAPMKRVGMLLGGAYVVASTDYTTYATAAAALGWVVAAYMVAPPRKETAAPAPAPPDTPRDAIVQWLTDVIGDRPGIHLRELYPRMRSLPGMEKYDDAALRGALKALDITITRAFTIGDDKGLSGVRLADLNAPLPPQEEQPLSKGEDAGKTTCSAPEEPSKSAPSPAEESPAPA